jgi:four helix bundle protein
MNGARRFQELAAWRLAQELKLLAQELCRKPEVRRDFTFHHQLREAARSAPRNIAEGFGRFKHADFARFVRIAKASETEVLNQFIDARDSGFIDDDELAKYDLAARRALKAANGLIRYLESTPDPD